MSNRILFLLFSAVLAMPFFADAQKREEVNLNKTPGEEVNINDKSSTETKSNIRYTSIKKEKLSNTRGYIAVTGGVGIPVGAFGSAQSNFSNAGFAKPGFSGIVEAAMPLGGSHFGIAAKVGYDVNGLDASSAVAAYVTTHGSSATFSANGSYQTTLFMGGLFLTFPVNKFSVDVKLLGGMALCSLPGVNTVYYNTFANQTYTENYPSVSAQAFAYGGDITLRYAVADHVCVLLQAGIINTNPEYPIFAAHLAYSYNGDAQAQPTTIVNISAGVGYQF